MIPLCHVHNPCSKFWPFAPISPISPGAGFARQDGQWYNPCCSSPCLHLRRILDQTIAYSLFCTHPPSTTSFLVTCRSLSVQASLVFLRSRACIGSSHTPSFISSCLCFVSMFSNRPSWLVSKAPSVRPAGRPLSRPPPPALQTARCATVPRSRVSRMAAPAGPLHVCTSKI